MKRAEAGLEGCDVLGCVAISTEGKGERWDDSSVALRTVLTPALAWCRAGAGVDQGSRAVGADPACASCIAAQRAHTRGNSCQRAAAHTREAIPSRPLAARRPRRRAQVVGLRQAATDQRAVSHPRSRSVEGGTVQWHSRVYSLFNDDGHGGSEDSARQHPLLFPKRLPNFSIALESAYAGRIWV